MAGSPFIHILWSYVVPLGVPLNERQLNIFKYNHCSHFIICKVLVLGLKPNVLQTRKCCRVTFAVIYHCIYNVRTINIYISIHIYNIHIYCMLYGGMGYGSRFEYGI